MAAVKDLSSLFSKIDLKSALVAKSVAAEMAKDNTDGVGLFRGIIFDYQPACWLHDLTTAVNRCSAKPTAALVCLWSTKMPQKLKNVSDLRLDTFYTAFVDAMVTETVMMLPVTTDDPDFVTYEASDPVKWSHVIESRETSCLFLTSSDSHQVTKITNAKVTAAYCNSMDLYGLPDTLIHLKFFVLRL